MRPQWRRRGTTALLALVLLAGHSLTVVTATAAAAEVPRPELLYTFDGPADASTIANEGTAGDALDGVIRNASTLARDAGAVPTSGQAGVFPGAPRDPSSKAPYVEIPNGLFGDAKALTVATWIKWDGRYSDQLPWSFIVGSDGLPANNWGVYYQPNEGGRSAAVTNSGTEVKATAEPLPAERWTHLTISADSSSVTYYINGAQVASEPVQFDVSDLSSPSSTFSGLLGRVQWSGEWAAYFPGEFDDFSVYREALNRSQVASLFATYTGAVTAVRQSEFAVSTPRGVAPTLPATVGVTYDSGSSVDLPISWSPVPASAYAVEGSTFQVTGTLPGWTGRLTATVTVTSREVERFAADFAQDTGAFRGGASGTLYGLGDEQSPTQAIVNGAAMTNISQKPPFGTQHPGGDAFNVEKTFFAKWGKYLNIYAQDYYPDWPYHSGVRPGDELTYTRNADGSLNPESTPGPDGVWDYLQVLDLVTEEVATNADDPSKYVFLPFNEPDWIWYSGDKYEKYLVKGGQSDSATPNGVSDWQAAWDVITDVYARHGLARPQIASPGDAAWLGTDRYRSFLASAKATNTVPDIFVWHELGGYTWMPDRMPDYRRAAMEAGIAEADIPPVNITEWGAISDMSSPANLLTWFASMEAAKVDAQTAYWTASGTLSDNQAKVGSANGGYWLFNWYGDLHGSRTVAITENERQAIAAIDRANKRAQVILGGVEQGKDAQLALNGLDPAVFGDAVDIEVRETRIGGTDGEAGTPRLVAAADGVGTSGASIRIPSSDPTSAYQVIVTPSTDRSVAAELTAQPAEYTIEAEDTALTAAEVRDSPGDGYRASNGRDVRGFATPSSRADWTVSVARDGLYRFQVIGATPGVPVQHALVVDDGAPLTVQYGANAIKPAKVQSVARGSAEVLLPLTAGEHTLSLRTSEDGKTLLPNAGYSYDTSRGVTLDRFSLTRVGDTVNTESVAHPAATLRLAGGASLVTDPASGTWVQLGEGARSDLYPATLESGYYDLQVRWSADAGTTLGVVVNGRQAARFTATAAVGTSSVRVHLPEGVSEIELTSSGPARVAEVRTTRAVEGDAAIVRVEAEDASKVMLGGTARVTPFGTGATDGLAGTGGGTGYVAGLGITDRNPANEGTLTVARGAGFDTAGEYDAVVHYSNDVIEGTHSYNPQVVDLGLQAQEAGSAPLVGRTTFRYTYLAANFWEAVMPLTLTTGDGALRFGNTRETLYIDEGSSSGAADDVAVPGYAIGPNVDWIAFAPFVLDAQAPTGPVAVSAQLTGDGGANAAGWFRSPVAVTFTTDAPAGDDVSVEYRLKDTGPWVPSTTPLTLSADGTTTVAYRAVRDGEPVSGSAGSTTVRIDRTPPVTAVRTDPASGTAPIGGTITARFRSADDTSGVASTEYSVDGGATWAPTPADGLAVTAEGSTVVLYRSVDGAGNVEPDRSITLTIAAPADVAAVAITSTGAPSADGWYNQPVLVRLTAPRATQRVQYRLNGGSWRTASSSPFLVSSNGVTTIDHRLVASNVVVDGSEAQTVVAVDRQAPTVSIARTQGYGSPRNPISVAFTGKDALSGVSSVEYRIDSGDWTTAPAEPVVFDQVGNRLVSYRAIDRAGNVSWVRTTAVIVRDNTPTSVKVTSRSVSADGYLTVVLAGFRRWDDVTVSIGGRPVDTVLTDRDGAGRVTLTVPAGTAGGPAEVLATGTDGTSGTTTVTVRS